VRGADGAGVRDNYGTRQPSGFHADAFASTHARPSSHFLASEIARLWPESAWHLQERSNGDAMW